MNKEYEFSYASDRGMSSADPVDCFPDASIRDQYRASELQSVGLEFCATELGLIIQSQRMHFDVKFEEVAPKGLTDAGLRRMATASARMLDRVKNEGYKPEFV